MHLRDDKFGNLEDFVIDKERGKMYFCNFEENKILIVDIKTSNIVKEIDIVGIKKNSGATRICCNEDYSKLIVLYEYSILNCLIDLNTYDIKYISGIANLMDGVIYNKYRECFLVSFYDDNEFLQEIDIKNNKIRKIKADKYQGYIAISESNKEIYVTYYLQGRIGVYDAETMKLKRKIKSEYITKNIRYDEELNILIAPSYFTGYVDIFLMDGSDKLLTREFVGYELRDVCFDSQKQNLYICSINGLYKKQIDIKGLIEQSSNVSHETKN